MKKTAKRTALLEIGVEELPARFVDGAQAQLRSLLETTLTEAGLNYDGLQIWGTPRRLVAFFADMSPKAKDREEVVIGPPPKAAKDDQGQWTQVARGFAKAQKVSVDKLEIRNTAKGERLTAVHFKKGLKTEQILKELFPAVIQKLTFPKSMVWEDKRFRFARPLRWIVALYNQKVVRFEVAGVPSERTTYGLLALGGKKISITKAERYKATLQSRCILVDPADRRKNILSQLESISKKAKGKPIVDEAYLNEVVYLTEYPTGILGHFPEAYLSLPREVLISVLRKHQKFFPLDSSSGKLTNAFIGFRNGLSEAQDIVRSGYERVLIARLADAKFFFEQDTKVPLEDFGARLNEVGFHEKLGTLLDKMERVKGLVETFGQKLAFSPSAIQETQEAAGLAKADLLTQMVGELPELQGIAGRFYARHQKKASSIAQAIEQHYWPITSEGPLPKSEHAALLAVADKIDTLVANFSVGLIPSGSADPYGLRRAAVGFIRILIDRKWNLPLTFLIDETFSRLPKEKLEGSNVDKLKDFIVNRVDFLFRDQGYRADEIDSLRPKILDGEGLFVIQNKLQGLKTVRGRDEFQSLAAAIKRARNILTQAKQKGFNYQLNPGKEIQIEGDVEKSLLKAVSGVYDAYDKDIQQGQYEEALLKLATLRQPVDAFFDGVMVMANEPDVREKRLTLLSLVKVMFDKFGDFSKLQPSPN